MSQKNKQKKPSTLDAGRAQVVEGLSQMRERYAAEWEASSAFFDREGHYDWMASFLGEYPLVFEVGTGTGRGTLALLRAGHTVVSVDENPACLQQAEALIRDAGHDAHTILRESINATSQHYQLGFKKISAERPKAGALLVQGDVLDEPPGSARFAGVDPNLEAWLASVGPFDAVACWLIGTHNARYLNIAIQKRRVDNPQEYRLRTQNYLYVLADRLLRPGGMLHIVDRGEFTDNELLRKDVIFAHMDQASPTTLAVQQEIHQRQYRDSEEGIGVVTAVPLSGRRADVIAKGLTSVRSIKPAVQDPA